MFFTVLAMVVAAMFPLVFAAVIIAVVEAATDRVEQAAPVAASYQPMRILNARASSTA